MKQIKIPTDWFCDNGQPQERIAYTRAFGMPKSLANGSNLNFFGFTLGISGWEPSVIAIFACVELRDAELLKRACDENKIQGASIRLRALGTGQLAYWTEDYELFESEVALDGPVLRLPIYEEEQWRKSAAEVSEALKKIRRHLESQQPLGKELDE